MFARDIKHKIPPPKPHLGCTPDVRAVFKILGTPSSKPRPRPPDAAQLPTQEEGARGSCVTAGQCPLGPLFQDPAPALQCAPHLGRKDLENSRQDPLASGNPVAVSGTQLPTGWLEGPTYPHPYNSKTLLHEITQTWWLTTVSSALDMLRQRNYCELGYIVSSRSVWVKEFQ